MPEVRIGISGWTYAPWRGTFFPKGLRQKDELRFAASRVRTIEINGTFYSLQRPSSFGSWIRDTPADFLFAVKGSRFITHMKRLKDVTVPLANFFASGILRLGPKLGPILWQLPPQTVFDAQRLANFFQQLPRSHGEARSLAEKHDARLKVRAWLKVDDDGPLRYALEVRHPTFENGRFIDLLREHDIALVVADTAGKWPLMREVTADFVYVRLHGDKELYASGYSDEVLAQWAERIDAWRVGKEAPDATRFGAPAEPRRKGRDVFVYFDNDIKTHAPFDAMRLVELLANIETRSPPPSTTLRPRARLSRNDAVEPRRDTDEHEWETSTNRLVRTKH